MGARTSLQRRAGWCVCRPTSSLMLMIRPFSRRPFFSINVSVTFGGAFAVGTSFFHLFLMVEVECHYFPPFFPPCRNSE